MSRTVVIGIRVPKELKEELERLGINYSDEVRKFLTKLVREKRAEKLIKEIDDFMARIKPIKENLAAELIREDRNEG